jgi:DNA modification methylase
MTIKILQGNCINKLKTIADKTYHTCVTSPPYWGLRDYGVDNQLGLEETPQEYVANMVQVFRKVRRVLRDDGTVWLNLGDSYASNGTYINKWLKKDKNKDKQHLHTKNADRYKDRKAYRINIIKPKDLIGIPWRVAFALQEDGWYLRQDIIWHKPNPMPESVKDRCTKSHEYIFLLSKSKNYYFDNESIKIKAINPNILYKAYKSGKNISKQKFNETKVGRNSILIGEKVQKRSVWTVTTKPYKEAHFATYPPDLIEPCILAGCPKGGHVLDPFGGSGTTALVADRLGRNATLIELNKSYVDIINNRLKADNSLFMEIVNDN